MRYRIQTIILLIVGLTVLSMTTFFVSADKYKITLFFLDNSEEPVLKQEKRDVDMPDDVIERMKVVLRNLSSGSEKNLLNVIPQETKIKEIFLDKPNKIVYVDLSDNLRKNHMGGTTAELLTIRSIFKTLQANFPKAIDKAQILINGREVDTLAGHIDLSQPLPIELFEKTD